MYYACLSMQYKYEDFAQFINVVSINASDNHLPLGELESNIFSTQPFYA